MGDCITGSNEGQYPSFRSGYVTSVLKLSTCLLVPKEVSGLRFASWQKTGSKSVFSMLSMICWQRKTSFFFPMEVFSLQQLLLLQIELENAYRQRKVVKNVKTRGVCWLQGYHYHFSSFTSLIYHFHTKRGSNMFKFINGLSRFPGRDRFLPADRE